MRGGRGCRRRERTCTRRSYGACILLLLLAPFAAAHGAGDALPGDSLARATPLGPPPARVFEALEAGVAHYYRFEPAGDARLRLFAPVGAAPRGLVLAVVFGPDLPNDTPIPAGVERPEGMGALVFPATGTEELLDARVPARRVLLLDRALELPATEHVLVLLAESDARVAVFLEGGAPWPDWFLVPTMRADERAWAGAPAWVAYAAGLAGAAPAAAYAWRARRRGWPLLAILGLFASALFGASTTILIADAVRAGGAPWLLLGAGVVASALAAASTRLRAPVARRVGLALAGIVGFVAFAGFVWGPVAALAGAVLPEPAPARD